MRPQVLPKMGYWLFLPPLTALNAASGPQDLSRPSWRLHGLSGDRAGFYAVTVQANWRLTFRFIGADVALLDYLDYH